MSDDESIHAVVSGRVQGVGFRDFAAGRAQSLGLTGYVRNLEDGPVEVVAEGPREALEILIDRLRVGPDSARVTAVEVEWGAAAGAFEGFVITW